MPSFRESPAYLTDGRPIYYFEEGDGQPLIYLHGATVTSEVARPMFELLCDRLQCVALDRTGHGRSGRPDRDTTVEEQVEAVAVVHRACSADPAWVFGHSAGGVFAVAYTIAHPDQVRGLVLMEPPLLAAIPAMERTPLHTMQIEGLTPLLRAGQLREMITEFSGTFFPDQSPELRREMADEALATNRSGWESFAKEHPVVAVWSPTPAEWSRITQPALVLAGGSTVGWFQELAAKVAELLPRGELSTLEGLGHGAPIEAPDVVAEKIIEFIDRHQAP